MNVILIAAHELSGETVMLSDTRARHIVKVLQCEAGDTVKLGIINGRLGTGKILGIQKKYPFRVELVAAIDILPPPKNPVDILLALPRPIMLRRILSQIASLGVENLHIVNANRVEKSFWQAGLIDPQEYMAHLIHGLEQAVDTVLPNIIFHRHFKPFIEDVFPGIAPSYRHLIYAHPLGTKRLSQIISPGAEKILLAVGPEGGWVDYETNTFEKQGFTGFSIGPRILKVDTAVVNIHGRIMAEVERSRRD